VGPHSASASAAEAAAEVVEASPDSTVWRRKLDQLLAAGGCQWVWQQHHHVRIPFADDKLCFSLSLPLAPGWELLSSSVWCYLPSKLSPLLSQGRELRSKAAGHADVQKDLSPTSISALQNSYSLSVSYAQVRFLFFRGVPKLACMHFIATKTPRLLVWAMAGTSAFPQLRQVAAHGFGIITLLHCSLASPPDAWAHTMCCWAPCH